MYTLCSVFVLAYRHIADSQLTQPVCVSLTLHTYANPKQSTTFARSPVVHVPGRGGGYTAKPSQISFTPFCAHHTCDNGYSCDRVVATWVARVSIVTDSSKLSPQDKTLRRVA